jgi:hypothetical protein
MRSAAAKITDRRKRRVAVLWPSPGCCAIGRFVAVSGPLAALLACGWTGRMLN